MSSHAAPDVTEHEGADESAHAHPTDAVYIRVAIILAVVTAIEVGLYYQEIPTFNNAALLILAVLKFAIVAGYFMHLRFDNPILRRLFITGLVLAVGCYLTYLMTLGVFIG